MRKILTEVFWSLFLDKAARNKLKLSKEQKKIASKLAAKGTKQAPVSSDHRDLHIGLQSKKLTQDKPHDHVGNTAIDTRMPPDRSSLIKHAVNIHRKKQILLKQLPPDKRLQLRKIAMNLFGQALQRK